MYVAFTDMMQDLCSKSLPGLPCDLFTDQADGLRDIEV